MSRGAGVLDMISFSTLCSGRVFATREYFASTPVYFHFQYPVFGSSVCNLLHPSDQRETAWSLSVPCVRVECLQLSQRQDDRDRHHSFSTLCSGRVFATLLVHTYTADADSFQYPVFGSSVCNKDTDYSLAITLPLSVPCVRVECLQPA